MYSHVLVGSNDIARSKKFYDALFTAIGGQPGAEMRPGRIAYTHNGARFVVTVPNDGKPATAANGGTIGCNVGDPKLAEAWHKAGVANGGTSIEDPPGVRPNGAYLAYLRDPRWKQAGRGCPSGFLIIFRAEENRSFGAVLLLVNEYTRA